MEIKTIPNRNPEVKIRVEIKAPVVGICPYSQEPQVGSFISVKYEANESIIEIHAVEEFLEEISKGSEPLDLETVVQMLYSLCKEKFEGVFVRASYKLKSGTELICESQS